MNITRFTMLVRTFIIIVTFAAGLLVPQARADLVAAGEDFGGAIVDGGVLYTWGQNASGQLGHSTGVKNVPLPKSVPGLWDSVAMGSNFTVAIDKNEKLWAWGSNATGQLGNGSSVSSSVPVAVVLPADAKVKQVIAGSEHVVALVDIGAQTGLVYTWGANASGQLGQVDTVARSLPQQVKLAKGKTAAFRSIAATSASSFAIDTKGGLWAWGFNGRGELGLGKNISAKNIFIATPTRVGSSSAWSVIAGGGHHVLALQGAKLYAWGDNSQGQLGTGTSSFYKTGPALITVNKLVGKKKVAMTWKSVSAGAYHSYAINSAGDAYAWGYNQSGALAIEVKALGSNAYKVPQLVMSADVNALTEIACGNNFTIGINSAGEIFSVGLNTLGQLGNGGKDDVVDATPNFGLTKVGGVSLAAGQPVLSSTTLGVNTAFSTTVSVANIGGGGLTDSYFVRLYLSSNNTLDTSDQVLVEREVSGPLAGGATTAVTFSDAVLSLPETGTGTYYLISQVYVDGDNPYSPANGAAVQVKLVGPDLSLEQVTTANTTIDAATTSINSVVLKLANRNYGLVPAGKQVKVEAFLSTDSVLDPSADTLLYTYTKTIDSPGLASAQTVLLSLGDIPVPSGLAGGSYQLIFVVNRNAAIEESGSSSNTIATSIIVAGADLAVSSPVLPSVTLATGETLKKIGASTTVDTVYTYLQNQGPEAYAGACTVNLYLSEDGVIDPSDTLLASQSFSSGLSAYGSVLLTWTNVAIPNVDAGKMNLIAQVELPESRPDRNQLNNFSPSEVMIAGPALSFSSFIFPQTTNIVPGSSLGAVSYKLTNTALGAVPAGGVVAVEVFLSEDAVLNRGSDVLIDQYNYTDGISAGASILLPSTGRSLSLPVNIRNGIYNLLFVATVNGTSTMSVITSQVASHVIAVGALDVRVAAPALARTDLGTNSVLSDTNVTVTNGGDYSIPSGLILRLYLSKNASIEQDDTLLGTQTLVAPLASGESRTLTFSNLLVPDIGQGSYKILAELVLPSGQVDIDVSNNIASTSVTLTRPNLIFSDISVGGVLDLDQPAPAFQNVHFKLINESLGDIPASVAVRWGVYLSRDDVLSSGNDILLQTGQISGGIPGILGAALANTKTVNISSMPVPSDVVGGTYYLLFVANLDGAAVLSGEQIITVAQQIILQKVNAPGLAIDYGAILFGGDVEWRSVGDNRALEGQAYEASGLAAGQTATMTYRITGPCLVSAPWKILAETNDTLSYAIDGVIQQTISGYSPTFKQPDPNLQPISIPAGPHTVVWTYTQGSANSLSYARVDLEVPSYITTGDDSWAGVPDAAAPVNGNYAQSPQLEVGKQSSLEVIVQGPALVSFWWKTSGTAAQDTLTFSIDGVTAGLPTTEAYTTATPATISGSVEWSKVAFLIDSGPRTLRWTYTQGSVNMSSYAGIDGLEVLTPIPLTSDVNRNTNPLTHAGMPPRNTDLAILSVTAPTGTYLLDDAQGTSRLPVNIHVGSVGADFTAVPVWDSSKLELRLSTNRVAGDSDDIILGSYARRQVFPSGASAIFDSEVNLPLDIPTGDYYLIATLAGSANEQEFTLANNTVILGPGYHIKRAPNLVLVPTSDDTMLSSAYPYHAEDSVFLHYTIGNTGLGTILPADKFKVRLTLMSKLLVDKLSLTNNITIKTYNETEYSTFLPEASGAYPTGGVLQVTQYIDLPTPAQIVIALGLAPAGTPEDSGLILAGMEELIKYHFYFKIDLDVENTVAESSETNTFKYGDYFTLQATPEMESFISYIQQSPFSNFDDSGNPALGAGVVFSEGMDPWLLSTGSTGGEQLAGYFWSYALYGDPYIVDNQLGRDSYATGQPSLLFQEGVENGLVTLNYTPFIGQTFNTISFDFNVRAVDAEIDVQATDDIGSGPWETLITLTPPYTQTSGARSLSGYGGLKDDPIVLAVDANTSYVQTSYAARITVRDSKSLAIRGASGGMRLVVRPTVAVPAVPTDLAAVFTGTTVLLTWTGTLPVKVVEGVSTLCGYYIIEHSMSGNPGTYEKVGTSITSSFTHIAPISGTTHFYRVRALTSGGSTAYSTVQSVVLP